MQRLEEYRRIDVALMVGAEHHGPVFRQMLAADDAIADARRPQRKRHAGMAEVVEHTFEPERDDDKQREGADR